MNCSLGYSWLINRVNHASMHKILPNFLEKMYLNISEIVLEFLLFISPILLCKLFFNYWRHKMLLIGDLCLRFENVQQLAPVFRKVTLLTGVMLIRC